MEKFAFLCLHNLRKNIKLIAVSTDCWIKKFLWKFLWFVCHSQVSIHTGTKSDAGRIATTGVDGSLILWDLKVSLGKLSFNEFVSLPFYLLTVEYGRIDVFETVKISSTHPKFNITDFKLLGNRRVGT